MDESSNAQVGPTEQVSYESKTSVQELFNSAKDQALALIDMYAPRAPQLQEARDILSKACYSPCLANEPILYTDVLHQVGVDWQHRVVFNPNTDLHHIFGICGRPQPYLIGTVNYDQEMQVSMIEINTPPALREPARIINFPVLVNNNRVWLATDQRLRDQEWVLEHLAWGSNYILLNPLNSSDGYVTNHLFAYRRPLQRRAILKAFATPFQAGRVLQHQGHNHDETLISIVGFDERAVEFFRTATIIESYPQQKQT